MRCAGPTPFRTQQRDVHEHAAERQCWYPAHGRGAGLEFIGDRRQHRRLIVYAAGDYERRTDQQRDQHGMVFGDSFGNVGQS